MQAHIVVRFPLLAPRHFSKPHVGLPKTFVDNRDRLAVVPQGLVVRAAFQVVHEIILLVGALSFGCEGREGRAGEGIGHDDEDFARDDVLVMKQVQTQQRAFPGTLLV